MGSSERKFFFLIFRKDNNLLFKGNYNVNKFLLFFSRCDIIEYRLWTWEGDASEGLLIFIESNIK
jgi:hypothetical protein